MDVPRRRLNTYGKASKRPVVHDLFASTSRLAPHQRSSNPASSRERTPFSDVSENNSASEQLKTDLLADLDASLKHHRLRSPARKAPATKNSLAPSVYDIDSSGEDRNGGSRAKKTIKRRKVTPNSSDIEGKASRGRNETTAYADTSLPGATDQQRNATTRARSAAAEKRSKSTQHSRTHSLKPRSKPLPRPLSPPLRFTPEPLTPPGIRSPASDTSNASIITTRSAAKRKRDANDGALSDVSSPSQLELSSLHLTPRRNLPRSSSGERSEPDATVPTPARVRRRLIDRLDAAKSNVDKDFSMGDAAEQVAPASEVAVISRSRLDHPKGTRIVDQNSNSQPENDQRHETIRPRKYGKQRSHLSGMVADIDSQSQSDSQPSFAALESQLSTMTGAGSGMLSSQFDFEMETDDEGDNASQLKSIHELRQAGAVNRYDRDLDSLLEDITSTTKAVRITALMQFVRKLKEQAFKRHFLDRNKVSVLIESIRSDYDILSSSIMLLAFWTLAHSESATSHILLQLYQGILRLPARLLIEQRPLSTIAKDRRENLSNILKRDLIEFEAHVLEQSSGATQSAHIITSRITLRAVETLQRRLVAGGESLPSISRPWIQAAMSSIKQHMTASVGNGQVDAGDVESIRLVTTWLELAESSSGSIGNRMSPSQLSELGALLGDLLEWAGNAHSEVEHLSLKLVMGMSSGKKSVSASFASTKVLQSIFRLLEHKYPSLLDRTRKGLHEDETTSAVATSVILGLGCLVDFADSSDKTRLEMMDMMSASDGASARLLTLVEYFDLFVKEADEATDETKAPILIPFGYLCLLLCTLSLTQSIRHHFSAALRPNLTEIINRAATFLAYLSSVSVGDTSAQEFVSRFGKNLRVLKEEHGG